MGLASPNDVPHYIHTVHACGGGGVHGVHIRGRWEYCMLVADRLASTIMRASLRAAEPRAA
eukprot:1151629-Pelagomonas_calceolata.AAC.5